MTGGTGGVVGGVKGEEGGVGSTGRGTGGGGIRALSLFSGEGGWLVSSTEFWCEGGGGAGPFSLEDLR